MFRVEGKIYVWTYKGDVFLRKDAIGAPKIPILSQKDITDLMEGKKSLDRQTLATEMQESRIRPNTGTPISNENPSITSPPINTDGEQNIVNA